MAHDADKRGRKPNILLVLADELGYGELGCHSPEKIRTPDLDRLATEGIWLTQFYSGSTVCAPSRCSLLAGKRTGQRSYRDLFCRPMPFVAEGSGKPIVHLVVEGLSPGGTLSRSTARVILRTHQRFEDDTGAVRMATKDILRKAEDEMKKSLEFLRQEFRGVRTGRATPALVDSLRIEVESYGSTSPLKELANIAVAEGNVIVIKPYDPSILKDIQRGIEKSGLGINPQNDGKMIRLPVPPLSTERRNQLAAHIRQAAEQQKVAIRNARRDANKLLEAGKKDKTLSEDDVEKTQQQAQKLTDDYCKKLDALLAEKTKEIMEG